MASIIHRGNLQIHSAYKHIRYGSARAVLEQLCIHLAHRRKHKVSTKTRKSLAYQFLCQIHSYSRSMYAVIKLMIQDTIPLNLRSYLARIVAPQAAFACLSSANTRFPLTKVDRTLPESSFPKYAEIFCKFCMNFLSMVQFCKNI
jgi:hypothetical protein